MAFHNNACAGFKKKSGLWNLLTRWPTPTASSSGAVPPQKLIIPFKAGGDEPSSPAFLPVSGGPACRKRLTDFLPPL